MFMSEFLWPTKILLLPVRKYFRSMVLGEGKGLCKDQEIIIVISCLLRCTHRLKLSTVCPQNTHARNRVSLCSPGRPRTPDLPASASQVLRLQVWTTAPPSLSTPCLLSINFTPTKLQRSSAPRAARGQPGERRRLGQSGFLWWFPASWGGWLS
jgi:hypothetical protein